MRRPESDAKRANKHVQLFDRMSSVAIAMDASEFSAQSIANIVNAFVKVEQDDRPLLRRVSPSSVLSAFADSLKIEIGPTTNHQPPCPQRHFADTLRGPCDEVDDVGSRSLIPLLHRLFRHLSIAAQSLPVQDYSGQAIGVIVNAFTRSSAPLDTQLMDYLSDVILQLPYDAFEAQNAALILNAYVKVERVKPALFQHMAGIVGSLDLSCGDAQNIAVIMNALVKVCIP